MLEDRYTIENGELRDGVDDVLESNNPESDAEPEREFLSTKSDDDRMRLIFKAAQREKEECTKRLQEELKIHKAEKQELEVELGRKSFFEDKHRRSERMFQISRAHLFKPIRTRTADGTFYEVGNFSGGAGPLDLQEAGKNNNIRDT